MLKKCNKQSVRFKTVFLLYEFKRNCYTTAAAMRQNAIWFTLAENCVSDQQISAKLNLKISLYATVELQRHKKFYCRALEFYCRVFLIIFKKGVLMSLEFCCRWSSTVAYKDIFKNYLKYWGSIVGGVLLSLEFTVAKPMV
jgi:hypothetical protein